MNDIQDGEYIIFNSDKPQLEEYDIYVPLEQITRPSGKRRQCALEISIKKFITANSSLSLYFVCHIKF